jgi:allophanate hydrolase
MNLKPHSFDIRTLATHYRSGRTTPVDVAYEVLRRIEALDDPAVFISILPRERIIESAERATARLREGDASPLLGVPFAVKDNIDVAGIPTTAGCPDFAYTPSTSSTVVSRLVEGGAIAIGKTNLDQFATGLVGTRSPNGTPRNPFDSDYIPGGSSSGSAVAVATGLVSFALGTDTAGSGRVPAAFNNVVGLKPTRGRLSTNGLVPACRSLDCLSVFALTCAEASTVMNIAAGFDSSDDFSLEPGQIPCRPSAFPTAFQFGVPRAEQMRFFGNSENERLFRAAAGHLIALGGAKVEIDFEPFAQCGELLYRGPWLAERLAATKKFIETNPGALLPVTRAIIEKGTKFSAVDAFRGTYTLQSLRRKAFCQWKLMDLMLLPTTGTVYRRSEVEADPLTLNSNLGYYTNFVNLMDLTAVAIPAGFTTGHLPFGVTLMAPAGNEAPLLDLGNKLHRKTSDRLGATSNSFPEQK